MNRTVIAWIAGITLFFYSTVFVFAETVRAVSSCDRLSLPSSSSRFKGRIGYIILEWYRTACRQGVPPSHIKRDIDDWLEKIKGRAFRESVTWEATSTTLQVTIDGKEYRYPLKNKAVRRWERNVRFFPFLQLSLGLSFHSAFYMVFLQSQGYALAALSSVMMALGPVSLISTGIAGYAGDRLPKRLMVIISGSIMAVGSALLPVVEISPVILAASQLLPVMGLAGLSVSLSSFLYGSLAGLGREKDFPGIYGNSLFLFWGAMSFSAILGGAIAAWIGQLPVVILSAAVDVVVVLSAFFVTSNEPAVASRENKNISGGYVLPVRLVARNGSAVSLVLVNVCVNNIFFIAAGFFLQPILAAGEIGIFWFAPVLCLASVVQAAASRYAPFLESVVVRPSLRTGYFFAAGGMLLLFATTAIPAWFIAAFVMMNFWQGISSVTEAALIHSLLDSRVQSRWLSFKSVTGSLVSTAAQGAIGVTLGMGWGSLPSLGIAISMVIVTSLAVSLKVVPRTQHIESLLQAA